MLELTKEVDENEARKWSKERLKAEMEKAKINHRKSALVGLIIGVCFIINHILGFIASGAGIIACWYLYKRHKRYKKLLELWKARL